jgi:putative SOS response-associated peptidase YedK
MCYTAEALLKRQIRHAKRKGEATDTINTLIDDYNRQAGQGDLLPRLYHQVSGFAHPLLPVITLPAAGPPLRPMHWGLIPHWCKDTATARKMAAQCLNARSETITEKPAFRTARGRGIVVLDAFYEYHHFMGRAYPFRIAHREGDALLMAALYDEWTDRQTGEVQHTCSIVTTHGQGLMAVLHNNPKAQGPRMPLLLTPDDMVPWLHTHSDPQDILRQRMEGLGEGSFLSAHPVRPLSGHSSPGNTPEASEPFAYAELALDTELQEVLEGK